MKFTTAVMRYLACPPERIVVIQGRPDPRLYTGTGVVIVFATWSGPACFALKAYSGQLPSLESKIPVWVVDIDALEESDFTRFGTGYGNGETFFFRKGVQVDSLLRPVGPNPGGEFKMKRNAAFGTMDE